MINLYQSTPEEIAKGLAERVRQRRKERKLTQAALASRAGLPLATYKRFERQGEISLKSLLRVAVALECEEGFEELFAKKFYTSIEDVINETKK